MAFVRPRGRLLAAFVLVSGLTAAASVAAFAAPGDLDRSFGGDGRVLTNFTPRGDGASGVALQADGKIVVAGTARQSGRYDFALARYRTDGTLDRTFGSNGRRTTRFAGSAFASAVAVQADGKIIVVGDMNGKFALARYTANGRLDSTFNGDGKATTSFPPHDLASAGDVAVQPDGRIVVVGTADCSDEFPGCPEEESSEDFAVARYDPDGTLDLTFGEDGRVTTDTGDNEGASTVALQPDGKIVAGGSALAGVALGLMRYEPDGTLDSTFGDGGMAVFSALKDARDIAIQPDGKIVAAGQAASRFGVARFNSDGSPDLGFSGDGSVRTDLSGRPDLATSVALQATGRIVAGGWSGGRFALARYNADGTLDQSFSGDGKVRTNFTSRRDAAFDIAVQANRRIVLVGTAGGSDSRFALARYGGG